MAAPPKQFRWSWRSAAFRGVVYQIVAVLLVIAAGWYLVHNTLLNMRVRGIQSGSISCSSRRLRDQREPVGVHARRPTSSVPDRAVHTLRVAIVASCWRRSWARWSHRRLSKNFLVRSLCTAYVEAFRNVPLLLQLFICIHPDEFCADRRGAAALPSVFFSKNGLQYPIPLW